MGHIEAFEILAPGPLTSVQDQGRFGYARYGVPPSGAVDSISLRIGNRIVGNPEGEAGLEITLTGFKTRALCDLRVAVTGGDLQPRFRDHPVPMWQSIHMDKGEVLSFSGPRSGLRAYLSVAGGLRVPVVMQSRSTNLGSGFGGLEGRPLRAGDILLVGEFHRHPEEREKSFDPKEMLGDFLGKDRHVRVLWGPQDDHFSAEIRDLFLESPYRVTPQSDRTGIRLEGPPLRAKPHLDDSIISEGVIGGTIQVPGDGRPIILLGETVTGGYRKIATVITADLFRLGQLRPGDSIRFRAVSQDEALEELRKLDAAIETLDPVPRSQ